MTHRNRLSNGRFMHDLDNWTVSSAAYQASDGDEHYGMAVIDPGGGFIEQDFSVPRARSWSIHLAVKPDTAALSSNDATLRIQDGDGNTVVTQNLTGSADSWNEQTYEFGLAPGSTYTARITVNRSSNDVKVDDVWIWWVPMTRADIADRINRKLARLATERSLSTAASGVQTEGDYTDAIDSALRSHGAVDPHRDLPDTRWLDASDLDPLLDSVEQEMLELLQRDYAVETDISLGPRSEKRSQIREALDSLTGSKDGRGGSRRPVVRKLKHSAEDFEL